MLAFAVSLHFHTLSASQIWFSIVDNEQKMIDQCELAPHMHTHTPVKTSSVGAPPPPSPPPPHTPSPPPRRPLQQNHGSNRGSVVPMASLPSFGSTQKYPRRVTVNPTIIESSSLLRFGVVKFGLRLYCCKYRSLSRFWIVMDLARGSSGRV